MENKYKESLSVIKALGALEYLINVHVEDKALQGRMNSQVKTIERILTGEKLRCPVCNHEMEEDEPFCLNCDHIQSDVDDQRRRDCEEISSLNGGDNE